MRRDGKGPSTARSIGTQRDLGTNSGTGGSHLAGLTEVDIATAHRYDEASREALARYERKGGK